MPKTYQVESVIYDDMLTLARQNLEQAQERYQRLQSISNKDNELRETNQVVKTLTEDEAKFIKILTTLDSDERKLLELRVLRENAPEPLHKERKQLGWAVNYYKKKQRSLATKFKPMFNRITPVNRVRRGNDEKMFTVEFFALAKNCLAI